MYEVPTECTRSNTKTSRGHLPPNSSGHADDVSLEGTSFCKNLYEFVFISYTNKILDQNRVQLDMRKIMTGITQQPQNSEISTLFEPPHFELNF
jgi:hypothetical protein